MNVDSCLISKKDILATGRLEADIEEYYRAMVYDIFIDKQPTPKLKAKKEYVDEEKKVVTFSNKNSKSIKDTKE